MVTETKNDLPPPWCPVGEEPPGAGVCGVDNMRHREILYLTKYAAKFKGITFTTDPRKFFRTVADNHANTTLLGIPLRHVVPGAKPAMENYRKGMYAKGDSTSLGDMMISGNYMVNGSAIPGERAVWLNPNQISSQTNYARPRRVRRETIAHEAFHAKQHLFGEFEPLARIYGGWRGPVPGSPVTERLRGVWDALQRYRQAKRDGFYS